MRAATLTVESHHARYRVPAGCASAPTRAALDRVLRDELPRRLAGSLGLDGDESVWRLRRLDLQITVGSGWSSSRTVDAFVQAFAASLRRALQSGPDGQRIVRYPDRKTFVARYLVDRARGRHNSRWEYGEFEELPRSSFSSAIRSLTNHEPASVLAALVSLSRADLDAVLHECTPSDGELLLDAFDATTKDDSHDSLPEVIATISPDVVAQSHHVALRLLLDVVRRRGGPQEVVVGTEVRRAREVAALIDVAMHVNAAALRAGAWRQIAPTDLARLAGVVTWPAPARATAVDAVRATNRAITEGVPIHTQLGGLFLLLPLLAEFSPLSDIEGLTALVLACALGGQRLDRTLADPAFCLMAGRDEVDAIAGLDHAAWPARFVETSIRHLLRTGKASTDAVVYRVASGFVAVEASRGLWLALAGDADEAVHAMRDVHSPVGIRAEEDGARDLDADLEYLRPPLDVPAPVAGFAVCAAQWLLRELAWRLPGFARSSLPYLAANVLACDATISVESERFAVEVGDPPLHLLLSMIGMNRRTFRLPATGDREWTVSRRS